MKQENILIDWLYRKLENTLSARENEKVEKWLEEPAHREYFSQVEHFFHLPEYSDLSEQELQEAWLSMSKRIKSHSRQSRKKVWGRIAVAASLVIMFTSYLFLNQQLETHHEPEKMVQIHPGQPNAILELANGQTYNLRNFVGQEDIKIANHIIVDSFSLSYKQSQVYPAGDLLFNTLTVPRGGEFKILLEDGTKVWLNSGSRMKYPEFFSARNREVYLEGEAYFEVSKDAQRPFIVYSGVQKITVLGTCFGITGYSDENGVSATLVEGKVKVEYPQITAQSYVLEPGFRIVYDPVKKTISQKQVDVREYVAWRDGKYVFNQKRLEDMLLTLSRWYDFEVLYRSPEVREILFSGELLRFDNFNALLKMIEKSGGVKFTIEGHTVIVSK